MNHVCYETVFPPRQRLPIYYGTFLITCRLHVHPFTVFQHALRHAKPTQSLSSCYRANNHSNLQSDSQPTFPASKNRRHRGKSYSAWSFVLNDTRCFVRGEKTQSYSTRFPPLRQKDIFLYFQLLWAPVLLPCYHCCRCCCHVHIWPFEEHHK